MPTSPFLSLPGQYDTDSCCPPSALYHLITRLNRVGVSLKSMQYDTINIVSFGTIIIINIFWYVRPNEQTSKLMLLF